MSRHAVFAAVVTLTGATAFAGPWWPVAWWTCLVLAALSLLGVWNLVQGAHSLLRNYSAIGHMRWFFEGFRLRSAGT